MNAENYFVDTEVLNLMRFLAKYKVGWMVVSHNIAWDKESPDTKEQDACESRV